MRVSLLQTNIVWSDPIANFHTAECLVERAKGSDLYILPEMWTTGFVTERNDIVEESDEHGLCNTFQWMRDMAHKYNAAFTGSVALRFPDGTCRNRMYFISPDGGEIYDKHHLFTYGTEDKTFTPGNKRVIVHWRGVRFLMQVCYDLRFPVFSRNKGDYDAAIYVANWPDSRRTVWDTLLKARAIENQCYVIGVNRVGDDKQCHYNGGSAVVDAYGRTVVMANDDEEQVVTTTLDMEKLRKFRDKFPVLNDRDNYSIHS